MTSKPGLRGLVRFASRPRHLALLPVVFAIAYLCVVPPIFLLEQGVEARACETARAAAGNMSALEAASALVAWENRNLRNIFNTSVPCYRPDTASDPLWSFVSRCGACDEYSTLFSRMMGCLGVESRVARDNAENHNWAEILVDGRWLAVDPVANLVGINASDYERELGQNISYVIGRYGNGTQVDLTSRYTGTGRLTTHAPGGSRIIIYTAGGREVVMAAPCGPDCSVSLGGNTYVVMAVRYGLLFDEKTVEVAEGGNIDVSLEPSRIDPVLSLSLLPKSLVIPLLVALLSILVWFALVSALFLLSKNKLGQVSKRV